MREPDVPALSCGHLSPVHLSGYPKTHLQAAAQKHSTLKAAVLLTPCGQELCVAHCQVKDWWTPSDQAILDDNDLDFGSSAPIPVLNDQFLFVGGKEGTLYLLNTTNLGGYNPNNSDANAHSVIEADKKEISGTNGIYRCEVATTEVGPAGILPKELQHRLLCLWCCQRHL